MAARIATPPMVGVPRLDLWPSGPSSRISCPKPCREKTLIRYGVSMIDTIMAIAAAIRMPITTPPPPLRTLAALDGSLPKPRSPGPRRGLGGVVRVHGSLRRLRSRAAPQQRVRDAPECGHLRRLDQHDVPGTQLGVQQRDGCFHIGHQHGL